MATTPRLAKPIRKIQKLRDEARGKDCQACGINDGTIVLAHLPYRNSGVSLKCPDYVGAWLCSACHTYADGDGRMDFQFRYLALTRTLTELFEDGVLIVK